MQAKVVEAAATALDGAGAGAVAAAGAGAEDVDGPEAVGADCDSIWTIRMEYRRCLFRTASPKAGKAIDEGERST